MFCGVKFALALILLSASACHCIEDTRGPPSAVPPHLVAAPVPSPLPQPVTGPRPAPPTAPSQPPQRATSNRVMMNNLEKASNYPAVLAALLAADAKSETLVEEADAQLVARNQGLPLQANIEMEQLQAALLPQQQDGRTQNKQEITHQELQQQTTSQKPNSSKDEDDSIFTCPAGYKKGFHFVHKHIHIHHHCFASPTEEPVPTVPQQLLANDQAIMKPSVVASSSGVQQEIQPTSPPQAARTTHSHVQFHQPTPMGGVASV